MSYTFLQDPSFWILVSFVLLMIALLKRIIRTLGGQLSEREETITRQINEVHALYEEAKTLLLEEQKNLEKKEKEADLLEGETSQEVRRRKQDFEQRIQGLHHRYKADLLQKRNGIEAKMQHKITNEFLEESCALAEAHLKKKGHSAQSQNLIKNRIETLSFPKP